MQQRLFTHNVFNQPEDLRRYDVLAESPSLTEALKSHASDLVAAVSQYGKKVSRLQSLGFEANLYQPSLVSFSKTGFRLDEVKYHDAYHQLMASACKAGIHNVPYNHTKGGHLAHMALLFIHGQAEAGTCCPISMTYAGIPLLSKNEILKSSWLPKALCQDYDGDSKPVEQKSAILLGMAMTEKQGGSDVRANQSHAKHVEDDLFVLRGHKWFCSAPMSDGFFVTAHAEQGLSCFLVPRYKRSGEKNPLYMMRLKDKLGNRSNASSEIEFMDCEGYLVGEPGKGIQTIIQMVALTRFDCITGSVALMRQAWLQAYHHCKHRKAFGKFLIDQPLMRQILEQAAVEVEVSLQFAIQIGLALDANQDNRLLVRLLTAIGKYYICKRTPQIIAELLECLGGAGFIEEFMMPRLYREAPLNAVWEGCGNIQCLDVYKTIVKEPRAKDQLNQIIEPLAGTDAFTDKRLAALKQLMVSPKEHQARLLVEMLATTLQLAYLRDKDDALFKRYNLLLQQPSYMLGAYSSQAMDPLNFGLFIGNEQ